jgi:hypothetical protein
VLERTGDATLKNRQFDANNFPHRRPLPENPRHHWVHDFKRRWIDLPALIIGLVVSPGAPQALFDEVKLFADLKKLTGEVKWSELHGRL